MNILDKEEIVDLLNQLIFNSLMNMTNIKDRSTYDNSMKELENGIKKALKYFDLSDYTIEYTEVMCEREYYIETYSMIKQIVHK